MAPLFIFRLLVAAFTDRDSWEMNALAFDGNVYLEDHVNARAFISQESRSVKAATSSLNASASV
jgi:hypothetical protein